MPATVATYQTISLDLDNVYTAINDLVNKFQPGMINLVEQQLVGPNGGQPLSFQNDIFGPLGDRITVISDFKKPIKEDSQRMLAAIALEDTKAFQTTLAQALRDHGRRSREARVSGHDDLRFRREPAQWSARQCAAGAQGPDQHRGRQGHAVPDHRHDLLEQVLRPGNASLADSTAYQTVAKEFPEKMSGMSYVRPDESARLSYDMIKSGQFEKAIQQGLAAQSPGSRYARPRAK